VAPPTKARPRVAYDLGRRGEPLPDDWHDDAELAGSYESGVDDRDAELAGAARRHGPPATPRSAAAPSGGGGEPPRRPPSGLADPADGVPWSRHPLSRGGGGGLFLGVLAYCLGRAFLHEGPYGLWRWYSAKFTNKVLRPAVDAGQGGAQNESSGGGPPARRLAS
jgi:hypothetical protein